MKDLQTKETLLMGHIHKGLYRFVAAFQQHIAAKGASSSCPMRSLNNSKIRSNTIADLWHRRLGHPCNRVL